MSKGVKINKRKSRRKTFHSTYSISTTGRTIKKVDISVRGLKKAATVAIPALLLIALVYLFAFSSTFKVTHANIKGTHRLVTADVYFMSHIDGKSIFTISPKKVAKRLETQVPYIKHAEVRLALPNKVTILIQEREPIIEWDNPQKPKWISKDGVVLETIGDAFNLMHLYDQQGKAVGKDGKVPQEYIKGMQMLHDRLQVSDFTIGPKGFQIHDPAGWEAYFGGPAGLCNRIENYVRMRKDWLNGPHPKYVDARYDRIYVGY